MTVTSFDSFYFAHDLPDLQVAFNHECAVTFNVYGVGTSFVESMSGYNRDYYISHPGTSYARGVIPIAEIDETYYPDADGNITIRGLRELMMCYLEPMGKDKYQGDSTKWYYPCLALDIEISATNTSTGELVPATQRFSTAVYYSRVNNATSPLYHLGFLSQYRQRTITPDMPILLSYIYFSNMGVRYRIGYIGDDNSLCEEVGELGIRTYEGEQSWYDFDIITNERRIGDFASLCNVSGDRVFSVTFERYTQEEVDEDIVEHIVDKLVVNIDHGHCRQKTRMWFVNCFGVPEVEMLTGSNTRSDEMEAEFSFIDNHYRKTYNEITEQHKVSSGHVDEQQYNSLLDLADSEEVYLLNEGGTIGDEVTITEMEFSDKRPHTEPTSVTLTYRTAEKQLRRLDRSYTEPDGIFDDSFDDSFE